MKTYATRNHCTIDRNNDYSKGSAVLLDEEGEVLWCFPWEWSDDQVWLALDFANRAYDSGFSSGKFLQQFEIRKALGCADEERLSERRGS